MEVVGGIVEGVAVVGGDACDRITEAGDIAQAGDKFVQADAEMPHDELGTGFDDPLGEFRGWRAFRVVMYEDFFRRVLVRDDLVQRGPGGFRDMDESEHRLRVFRKVGEDESAE